MVADGSGDSSGSADRNRQLEPAAGSVEALVAEFRNQIYRQMLTMSGQQPSRVLAMIEELRNDLDVMEQAVGRAMPSHLAASGRVATADAKSAPAAMAEDGIALAEDLGRNQRSRLREMILLEVMSKASRAFTKQELMAAAEARGFGDTGAAIVSQLHRMKSQNLISQPDNSTGLYEITDDGSKHLRKVRPSLEPLLGAGKR